jgi:hypothetical protein
VEHGSFPDTDWDYAARAPAPDAQPNIISGIPSFYHTQSLFATQLVRDRGQALRVSAAARIAKLPVEQQEAVVKAIEGGLKPKQALAQVQGTSAIDRAALEGSRQNREE